MLSSHLFISCTFAETLPAFVPPTVGTATTILAQRYAFGDLLSDEAAHPEAAPAKAASP